MLTGEVSAPEIGPSRRDAAAIPGFDLATLFDGLQSETALLLAVSGGPDSMALLRLVAQWADERQGDTTRLHVATVDHGLRQDARQEAEVVAETAARLGLPCAVLTWQGPKPTTRIQERARAARYALLSAHAEAIGARAILVAHHADDQAETVMMRLARGSGLSGLAGMSRQTPLNATIRLVRPLLDIPKAALVAYCRTLGQAFIDDPSNCDPRFARARLRAESKALERIGLDRDGLLRLSRRMARADRALEAETDRVERGLAPALGPEVYRARLTPACAEPEILLRLLRRAVTHAAAGDRVIRLARLESLTSLMEAALGDGRPLRATLAGARVVLAQDGRLTVTREAERRRGRSSPERIVTSS